MGYEMYIGLKTTCFFFCFFDETIHGTVRYTYFSNPAIVFSTFMIMIATFLKLLSQILKLSVQTFNIFLTLG